VPAATPTPTTATADALKAALSHALQGKDLNCVSLHELRQQICTHLGFPADGLEFRRKEIKKLAKEYVEAALTTAGASRDHLAEVLAEKELEDGLQSVYFITMSHVRVTTVEVVTAYKDLDTLERKAVADAVRDAFDNPMALANGLGRPRAVNTDGQRKSQIDLLVVFREKHADGSTHFHIVLKLQRTCRFRAAKRTLRERHQLPSHSSCSHTAVFSAMRYCHIETLSKLDVDDSPWLWTPSFEGFAKGQEVVDLFELSQEPWQATGWRKRREQNDKEAAKKKAKTVFEKLDLTSICVSKHLWSKDALMAYAQDHGTPVMQKWVHSQQRRLVAHLEDAKEWHSARSNAQFEAIDDWTLVCQSAEKSCPHGAGQCSYKCAVTQIFEANAATLNVNKLAMLLRGVLQHGPKKTVRVPFLIGPSNSGKSTIVYPFDDLFEPKRVLHKPALGSPFGLRNIVGGTKRFIFWDDYRPVEFAEKTVAVSLFLSSFMGQFSEIQVSQSFSDGNKDVQWNRGVVFTGKQEGLWRPTKHVGVEDIRHMRNRCEEFVLTEAMPDGQLQDVCSCAVCMCAWIVEFAAAYDAEVGLRRLPAQSAPAIQGGNIEGGLAEGLQRLVAAAKLPTSVGEALAEDLEELGAVSTSELTPSDWESLRAWAFVKPLQRRRFLQIVSSGA